VNSGGTQLRLAAGTEAAVLGTPRGILAAEIAEPRSTWIGAREAKSRNGKLSRDGSRCQVLVAVPGM
jgi:hypothetical protein